MTFGEKLKKAMQQLDINQAQLVGMTGIGKSSISQYLSGKNTPTEERQKNIAVSLGLDPDYFEQDEEPIIKFLKSNSASAVIPRIRPEDVAKLMRMNQQNIRKGLQQRRFDWGYAIKTSEPGAEKETYTYFINARSFASIEGIEVPPEYVY